MKYTTALIAFAAGALAQSSAITSAPATTAAPEAVETTECAAKCDQGDGSAEATQKYSDCVQSCIASLFPSSQTANVPGAGAAASGSAATGNGASGSAAATGSNRASGSAAATGSDASASAPAQATGAATRMEGAGLAGLAGLLAAFAF
ncbi:hypothetical protein N0V86_002088 [Didymella sp. IMI 355093]|nr:hypothetical protein N0V86_002088 [Didymella sp. IMI 355093]